MKPRLCISHIAYATPTVRSFIPPLQRCRCGATLDAVPRKSLLLNTSDASELIEAGRAQRAHSADNCCCATNSHHWLQVARPDICRTARYVSVGSRFRCRYRSPRCGYRRDLHETKVPVSRAARHRVAANPPSRRSRRASLWSPGHADAGPTLAQ